MSKQVYKVLRNSEIFAVINTKLQLAMNIHLEMEK